VGLLVVVAVLAALLVWISDRRFLNAGTLAQFSSSVLVLGCCALGGAVVILAGGIDISLGALMLLAAAIAGRLWQAGAPPPVAGAAALAVGAAGGLVNAGLSLVGRVHPIVVTLATMSLYTGLAHWVLGGIVTVPGAQREWLVARPLGVPLPALLGMAVLLVVWLLLTRTITGREIHAEGGNPAAARRVGILPGRVWLKAFAVQGLLVGLAGFLALARQGSVEPTGFPTATLDAIAAAVVGGVAIAGGRGSAWGVALGCLLLALPGEVCEQLAALADAPDLQQAVPYWKRTIAGAVLVLAVAFDALWRRGGRG
jgi:rhamnose transport system permease protein